MVERTIFDCIKDIPRLSHKIIEERQTRFEGCVTVLTKEFQVIDEIILIGSGTSDTANQTARLFMETVTGIRTSTFCPNEFTQNYKVYKKSALYMFVSQTGSSILTREVVKAVRDAGYLTIGVTESKETYLAKETDLHIDMGCEQEEFPTRTIGYTTSVVTLMVFSLELALTLGRISKEDYQEKITELTKEIEAMDGLPEKVMGWLDTSRRKFMQSSCLLFIASSDMLGVAREAAMKIWEIPQVASIGYEIEESLHGPNYGYNANHCVIVLNDGGANEDKMLSLARYTKDVYKSGYVIGAKTVDENDFPLIIRSNDFKCLPFSMVVQVLAFRMASDGGRDLISPHDNSIMYSYFVTHAE